MFQKKTTLIIGAGASHEVNLPLGSGLKSEIKNHLNFKFDFERQVSGSREIFEALRTITSNSPDPNRVLNEYIAAGVLISESITLAISIDNFIDAHKGNKPLEIVGKLAIAHAILKAERASKLFFSNENMYNKMNFDSLESTWYKSFFELITENCQADGLRARLASLTLIIFNYDRCVEYFLINALKQYYDLTYATAFELVSNINIKHPYGFLGVLPSQEGYTNNGGVPFGAISNPQLLTSIHPRIKTFTEGSDASESSILEIRQEIAESQILVFLGFAYHRLNLELLQPTYQFNTATHSKGIFGTSFDISLPNEVMITNDLVRLTNALIEEVHLSSTTCHKLFHEFGRSLSLS